MKPFLNSFFMPDSSYLSMNCIPLTCFYVFKCTFCNIFAFKKKNSVFSPNWWPAFVNINPLSVLCIYRPALPLTKYDRIVYFKMSLKWRVMIKIQPRYHVFSKCFTAIKTHKHGRRCSFALESRNSCEHIKEWNSDPHWNKNWRWLFT